MIASMLFRVLKSIGTARAKPWHRFVVAASVAITSSSVARSASADSPVLHPPVLRHDVTPTFPTDPDAQSIDASVKVDLDIDVHGAVTGARVVEGAGHGFDEAAIAAANALVFEPATRDGKPIASHITFRFHFVPLPVAPVPAPTPVVETPAPPVVGRLHGVVEIAGGDVPIVGARVDVVGPVGALPSMVVGVDGVFDLPALAPGDYRITVSASGFVKSTVVESVFAARSTDVVYRLALVASDDEIVVKGDRPSREVTVHTLEQRELERIPGTNGDAFKAIQSMPGVARAPGLGSALIVRGSAPQDTQVFIDGIPIPIIYHFGGLSSLVPTEILDKLDFRPGNFGVEYGRAIGGVIDASTIAAPTDGKFHALAQADFIDARFVAKGKIPFLDGWSFVLGGRRSYVDLWLKPLLSRHGAGFTTAPVYYDWQAFAETHPTKTSRLRIGFFGSDDRLEIFRDTVNTRDPDDSGDLGLHTGFGRVEASFDDQIDRHTRFQTVLAYGWDIQSFQTGAQMTDISSRPLVSRSEISMRLARGYTLHVGADVLYTRSSVNVDRPPPQTPGEPDATPSSILLHESDNPAFFLPAAYIEMEMQLAKRLRIVPGFRVDYNGATSKGETSPRISGRYTLIEGDNPTTLKGGLGLFYQLPQPQELSPVFGTPGLLSNRAVHASIGAEQTIDKRLEISVEGFYKYLDHLVVRAESADGGTITTNQGTGYVVGSEVLIRLRPDARFFGWIAYTLSRSVRTDGPGEAQHLFRYDQTHILTALGSYRIGGGWEIGARFRIVSGDPYTPCNGGAQDAATGSYSCIEGRLDTARLPLFHQLDLRVDKHWYFDGWQLSAYLDVYNAYDRASADGVAYNFDFSQHIYQSGLPILPSLGLRGEL